MALLGCIFLLFGGMGIAGSTFGSSGLAWFLSWLGKFSSVPKSTTEGVPAKFSPTSLDILVAAHNEEELIAQTLSSLAEERDRFLSTFPGPVRIWVGADHCTDATEDRAIQWAEGQSRQDVVVVKNPHAAGKWNVLEYLVSRSNADWVALVDVGANWEPGLLTQTLPHLRDRQVTGVAPSYGPASSGILERMNWRLERMLKSLESGAGGPISVHGSTVFYRRADLIKVYAALKFEFPTAAGWLNDDVVLPLMLRIQSPGHRIVYLTRKNGRPWVRDYGISPKTRAESGRRKRILIGNLQWMSSFYKKSLISKGGIGLIASRRVFRVLWAYWLLCGVIGITLLGIGTFNLPRLATFLAFIALLGFSRLQLQGGVERLRAAFWVGIELPLYWFTLEKRSSEKIWN